MGDKKLSPLAEQAWAEFEKEQEAAVAETLTRFEEIVKEKETKLEKAKKIRKGSD